MIKIKAIHITKHFRHREERVWMRMDKFERKAVLVFDVIGMRVLRMMEGVEMIGRGEAMPHP